MTFMKKTMARENVMSTAFGNMVAIPHPIEPITNTTFLSLGVLEKSIDWDGKEVHHIRLN